MMEQNEHEQSSPVLIEQPFLFLSPGKNEELKSGTQKTIITIHKDSNEMDGILNCYHLPAIPNF